MRNPKPFFKSHPLPDRMGGKLFLRGLITPRELSAALEIQRCSDTKVPIGKIILEMVQDSSGDARAEEVRAAIEEILIPGRSGPTVSERVLTASEIELLDIAVNGGSPDEARRCIKQFHANPNVRSIHPCGMTPLLKACSLGYTELALTLLACRADVNKRDLIERWTPLMHAVHTRNLVLLRGLLEYTPRLRVHNKSGEDAIEMLIKSMDGSVSDQKITVLMAIELVKKYRKSLSRKERHRLRQAFAGHDIVLEQLAHASQKTNHHATGFLSKVLCLFQRNTKGVGSH